ncbi:DUF4411 family protein [Glutamicibacter ardleyensis]|uniref:DUF4411 family protein n=1 Tax=Glutamicibacter ardleyensis TaxID=225894 RepID=UPI003FCF3D00
MYLLDSNIFITAKNLHYGFDFVPAFWDWLEQGHSAGILCSTEKVRKELTIGADELGNWAQSRSRLFLSPDASMVPSMQVLASWAHSGAFTPAAISEFLNVADFELIAYAHAHGHTIVTHERPNPLSKKRILIPDACDALGVPWIGPYEMLRASGVRFILEPSKP